MAVCALLWIAALASRGPLGGGGGVPAVEISPWAIILVMVGATILDAAALAYAMRVAPRRRRGSFLRSAIVALLLPVIAALALIVASILGTHLHHSVHPHPRGTALPSARHHAQSRPVFTVPPWVSVVVPALALIGAAVFFAMTVTDRAVPERKDHGALRPAVIDAVELSIEDLRAEPDPRRAVIAAYRTMEQTLARAGLPRAPSQAPREYLTHVLGALSVDERPVRTVTALFELAKFSRSGIDVRMRDDALDALLAIRGDLEPERDAARP